METNQIVQECIEEENKFQIDSSRGVVVGICEICEHTFPMQFGHDTLCKECKDMLSSIFEY